MAAVPPTGDQGSAIDGKEVGEAATEYFKIKIEDGRVMSVDIEPPRRDPLSYGEGDLSSTDRIEYTPQGPDGNALGRNSSRQWNAAGLT